MVFPACRSFGGLARGHRDVVMATLSTRADFVGARRTRASRSKNRSAMRLAHKFRLPSLEFGRDSVCLVWTKLPCLQVHVVVTFRDGRHRRMLSSTASWSHSGSSNGAYVAQRWFLPLPVRQRALANNSNKSTHSVHLCSCCSRALRGCSAHRLRHCHDLGGRMHRGERPTAFV